eukprot:TRINITY_DN20883_c0_g1_i1.p1 TRINITY_DN20883_c0_g1~~TRINITY_DN20883_c0_g1_i1.p1  ORF type:complete len:433 (+),score=140.62 TRINITY_DN20883_c0_g1_i1:138-1436(+)
MSVNAAISVSDSALAVREKLRGKISQVKVKRYWPGKAPEWAPEGDEEDEEDLKQLTKSGAPVQRLAPRHDDARLRRLAESKRDREEARAQHREIRAAEIISTKEEDERKRREAQEREAEEAAAEEEDDAIEARRARIRERLLQRQKEEELPAEEEDEESEEEESDYETDSEEEYGGVAMVKPVFVPKVERETIAEREKLEAEENALIEAQKKRLEERKVETRQLVVEEIRRDEEVQKNKAEEGEGEDVDTDDEINEAEEYEAWKAREIARIRRDREERDASAKEKEEIEKLRNMTEEERRDWERRNPKTSHQNKKKWKFMQKYYHKGAFFQENADDAFGTANASEIYHRDFSGPTGDDKMDKTILPKVMQVKHFGRSGRTKWTHLVQEDTTQWDNPWTYNDPLRAKYNNKMGGMKPIAKPRGSRKLKDWDQK